jgi:hypothetical protein
MRIRISCLWIWSRNENDQEEGTCLLAGNMRQKTHIKDCQTALQYLPSFGILVALWNRTPSNTTDTSVHSCLFMIAAVSHTSSCKTASKSQSC